MSLRTKLPGSVNKANGFTLIELMIAMTIGTIISAAAISLLKVSLSQNIAIGYISQLQERSFFVSHVLKQQFAQIGYRPISLKALDSRVNPIDNLEIAFPEVADSWEQSQTIKLIGTALYYRFHGASNASLSADSSIYDCLGNAVAEGAVQDNQISLQGTQLMCTVGDETTVLLGAEEGVLIEQIAFEIGVDDDGDNVVDRSFDASDATSTDLVNTKQLTARLLLATPDSVATDNHNYYFNGVEFESTDRKLRLESVVSMALRN